jgi:hypothetical protein
MTSRHPDWDDERLAAAFAARATSAPPAPSDLAVTVVERVVGQPRPTVLSARRLAPGLGAAAAIALAVIIGAGRMATTSPAASVGPTSTNGPSAANPSMEANASVPATVPAILGDILSVSRAVAIRDSSRDDREMAVTGFLARWVQWGGVPIPGGLVRNPTQLDPPADGTWLLDAPEVLQTTNGSFNQPTGPSIHLSFALTSSYVDVIATGPTRRTLIGHFDDRRAALCVAAKRAACGDTFVVDRTAAVDDQMQPVTTGLRNIRYSKVAPELTLDPQMSEADADRLVKAAVPEVTILSRQLVTDEFLGEAEPAIANDRAWTGQRLVWIVTALGVRDGVPVARTFLVVDGTSQVVEMTANGPSAQPTVSASVPPSPMPVSTEVAALLAHPNTVAAAIDQRDTALDSTELAVHGYAWGPAGPIACQLIRPGMPALLQCPSFYTWIADTKPASSAGGEFERPTGPAFNLIVEPETIVGIDIYSNGPVEVVTLGHFEDRRSIACGAAESTCRLNFVVDAIVDASDRRLDRPTDVNRIDPQVPPRLTIVQAIGVMGLDPTDPDIVAAFAVRPSALSEIEPEIAHAPELQGADIVWIVRWIAPDTAGRPILWTRITIDGDPDRLGVRSWDVMRDGLVSTLRDPDAPEPQIATPSAVPSGSGP